MTRRGILNDLHIAVDQQSGTIARVAEAREMIEWLSAEKAKGCSATTVEGGVALPGLIDAHMHPLYFPMLEAMSAVDLSGMDKSQVMETMQERHRETNPSLPLLFLNLDSVKVGRLSASDLKIFGERSAAVLPPGNHDGIVTAALVKQLKQWVTADLQLSGILQEDGYFTEDYSMATFSVMQNFYPDKHFEQDIEKKLFRRFSKGVTSLHDLKPLNFRTLMMGLKVRKAWLAKGCGSFPITRFYVRPEDLKILSARRKELESDGLLRDDDWHTIIGLKLFADGSFGSRSAMVSEHYCDCGGCGTETDSREKMDVALRLAAELGLSSIAVHAIGDAGIEYALFAEDLWSKYSAEAGINTQFRIEHFELPTESILKEVKQRDCWVIPQPNFLLDWCYEDRLGKRIEKICPHRDILDHGINMMFGTDGMPESMLYAIYLATHAKHDCQRVDLTEAVSASTEKIGVFEGDNRGTIEAGRKADLVIADPELLDKLSSPGPDVMHSDTETKQIIEQLESTIRSVYKDGIEVFNRTRNFADGF